MTELASTHLMIYLCWTAVEHGETSTSNGVVPRYQKMAPPHFDWAQGRLLMPAPKCAPSDIACSDIQEQSIRVAEFNPDPFHPKGYHPQLLEDRPAVPENGWDISNDVGL